MHSCKNSDSVTTGTSRLLRDKQVMMRSKSSSVITKDDDCNSLTHKKPERYFSSSDLVACTVLDDRDRHNEILDIIIREAHDNMNIVNLNSYSLGVDAPFRKAEEIFPVFSELQSHIKTHLFKNNVFEKKENETMNECLNHLAFLANCMFYPPSSIIDHEKMDFLQPTSLCTFNEYKLNLVNAKDIENLDPQDIKKLHVTPMLEELDLQVKSNDDVSATVTLNKNKYDKTSRENSCKSLGSLMDNSFGTDGDMTNKHEEAMLKPFQFLASFRTFWNVFKSKGFENLDAIVGETVVTETPAISYRENNYSLSLDHDDSQISNTSIEMHAGLTGNTVSNVTQPGVSGSKEEHINESKTSSQCDNVEYSAHICGTESRTDKYGAIDTVYIIEVNEAGNGTRRVEHSYSAFHRLHLDLSQQKLLMQSNFPQNYGPFAKLATKTIINRRKVVLNLWLYELTSHLAWGKITGNLKEKCICFLSESNDCYFDPPVKRSKSLRLVLNRTSLLFFLKRNSRSSQVNESESDTIHFNVLTKDGLLEDWPTTE